jgi:sugar phosphate isomerase/epimerase
MKLKFFCPRWGSEHISFNIFAKKVKEAGYDGIEMSLPLNEKEKLQITHSIRENDLLHIAQHWETATTNFEEHKKEYARRIENLAQAKPVLINSQTGRDFFSFEQNAELIKMANSIASDHNVKLVHETHRSKFSFAAHVVAEYLERLADLRLGFDVSHWINVAETYLQDQEENVELAISRADHIHSRVGFPEGPQIPDPRVPEWQEAVNVHLGFWKRIVERNRAEGKSFITITSEFGPFPYMTRMPYTQMPISNQWDINVYMMKLLKKELS